MKGVITAAGLGKRSGLDGKMRKEMLPVYDVRNGKLVLRPIIDVIISGFLRQGIRRIAVVLDPSDRWTREYIETEFSDVQILYQEEKRGFGHAVLMAKDFVGSDSFILNAGDGLVLRKDVLPEIVKSSDSGVYLTLMQVTNPQRYGTAEIIERDVGISVISVVEKSEAPPSNFALCALYGLPSDIFQHLEADSSHIIELTPAINKLIASGSNTRAMVIDRTEWVSVGKAESYVDVLKLTLDRCRESLTL